MEAPKIYHVAEYLVPALEQAVAKLSKLGEKLGSGPVTLNRVGQHTVDGVWGLVKVLVHFTITGNRPKLGEWELLGVLEHATVGNILRALPGRELPEGYRHKDNWCEHCSKNRRRNDTYVVTNGTETKQVGKSCLKDFTGHDKPEQVLNWFEVLDQIERDCGGDDDEWCDGSGRIKARFGIEGWLAAVAAEIRTNGWVSRTNAMTDKPATADAALANIEDLMDGKKTRGRRGTPIPVPNDDDKMTAKNALAWVRSQPESWARTDYLWNLRVVSHEELLEQRQLGIAASLVPAYQREMGKEAEARAAAATSPSKHLGKEKERIEFTGTVLSVFERGNDFGITYITKFQDEHGNRLVWFASRSLEEGRSYKVKGTVTKHSEFKGVKETTVTRCKCEEIEETAAARVAA